MRHAPNPVGALFSNTSLSNCFITISPQNMVLNVGSTASGPAPSRDFNYLFEGVSMQEFEW